MNRLLQAHILYHLLRRLPRKFGVQYDNLKQPFFIIGSGRNGSTMLNRMLNGHSELFLPSEQYFLGPAIFKFHYYNYAIWRDLVKIIVGELIPSGGSHTWAVQELPNLMNLYTASKSEKKLQYLIDQVFRSYGEKQKSFQVWGDTTPLNTYYLPEIYHTLPKAKYLFLVRDGRDVVASYKSGGKEDLGDLAYPPNAATHWMHSLKKYEYLRKRTNVKLIKYEDLVQYPERELSKICEYLSVTFEEEMLNFHQGIPDTEMYNMSVHGNLKKPVFKSSMGKYRKVLDRKELHIVNGIIHGGLKKMGYE